MLLADTHTHLHFNHYQTDLPGVLKRAQDNGVQRILTLGTDYHSSCSTVNIANKYDFIFAGVGIHPTEVKKNWKEHIPEIVHLLKSEPKIIAIGEIGLDLYWKDVPLSDQIPVFEKMLDIAEELNLPVSIHNRKAQREMQQVLRSFGIRQLRGVMHSFAGNIEDADFYLDLGMYISFTGVITFKNFKQMEIVKYIPLNRLLLETDSPFLAPVPHRGKRNEPAYIQFTARKLAEIHQVSYKEICQITWKNANNLFHWE